jgi:putative tricarboxylic transport membrane protein
VLFVFVARAFGSRTWLRDIIIGLILSFVVYIGFTYGLGLDLPAGVLAGIL